MYLYNLGIWICQSLAMNLMVKLIISETNIKGCHLCASYKHVCAARALPLVL